VIGCREYPDVGTEVGSTHPKPIFSTLLACIDPVPLASPLLLQLKDFFEQNNHGDLLLSPYAFLAIIITTNKIYVKPTIWTFRVWLVDQTISSIRSNNSFFSQNMDLPVY